MKIIKTKYGKLDDAVVCSFCKCEIKKKEIHYYDILQDNNETSQHGEHIACQNAHFWLLINHYLDFDTTTQETIDAAFLNYANDNDVYSLYDKKDFSKLVEHIVTIKAHE